MRNHTANRVGGAVAGVIELKELWLSYAMPLVRGDFVKETTDFDKVGKWVRK